MEFLRQKDCEMQISSKAYKRFISIYQSLRELVSPHDQSVQTSSSPSLAFVAAVLALLLSILELDLHQADLQLTGLMSEKDQADPVLLSFLSP